MSIGPTFRQETRSPAYRRSQGRACGIDMAARLNSEIRGDGAGGWAGQKKKPTRDHEHGNDGAPTRVFTRAAAARLLRPLPGARRQRGLLGLP
jgi:hypothetical protein